MNNPPDDDFDSPRGLRSSGKTFFLFVVALALGMIVLAVIFLPIILSVRDKLEDTPVAQPLKREFVVDMQISELMPSAIATCAGRTVVVRSPTNPPGDAWFFGSGFLVRDEIVITAAHVVADGENAPPTALQVYCGNTPRTGLVLKHDWLREVSVVRVNGCHSDAAQFDERTLLVDDPLHVVGFDFAFQDNRGPYNTAQRFHSRTSPIPTAIADPETLNNAALAAHIRQMQQLGLPRFQAIAGAAVPGQSGSPVFRVNGSIVGMLVYASPTHNRSFMVPATSIITVMHDAGVE